ncbi:MAG TPA: hypothetical protein VFH73_24610 [Polyangia bacterium]|jgi:hypothetical protein|nr:hypothetical protein [Polyangia bacterium]
MTRLPASNVLVAFSFLSIVLAGGNGGAASDAGPAPAPADKPAARKVPGFDVTWTELTPEQKAEYMKSTVLPKMKATFQAFDAKEFKQFKCTNCHGKDAKERKFKMPNPSILNLPGTPADMAALLQKEPKLQRWAKFMGEEVKPQMADLLGIPAFDPKKREAGGFGCKNCHVIKKAE